MEPCLLGEQLLWPKKTNTYSGYILFVVLQVTIGSVLQGLHQQESEHQEPVNKKHVKKIEEEKEKIRKQSHHRGYKRVNMNMNIIRWAKVRSDIS